MRPEQLQVVLRPRSLWEAVGLGVALVRQHARAVWGVWLGVSVPVFVLLNALCWWLDQLWLAAIMMWWWLPLFELAVLYVLSRAVFGQAPGVLETLVAWPAFGRGQCLAHLLWRRFSPQRTLVLPVDALEDGSVAARSARRAVLGQGQGMFCLQLGWLCLGFALLLALAVVLLVLLFVPTELLSESARLMWETLVSRPPRWAQAALNVALWFGFSVIGPFYVGAGFGLYLNRRVHLEGWDVELALRSLHARLRHCGAAGSVGALLMAAALPLAAVLYAAPANAQTSTRIVAAEAGREASAAVPTAREHEQRTLADVFGAGQVIDAEAFIRAVEAADKDPLLHPERIERVWVERVPAEEPLREDISFWGNSLQGLVRILAWLVESALWLLVGALVLAILLTAPRWWPWMRARAGRAAPREHRIVASPIAEDIPLPARIAASARELWRAGRWRQALALLYRGSVAALAERLEVHLVPGATEAECLRLSRHLPEAGTRAAFAQVVHVWQLAAYAGRKPDDAGFEALVDTLEQCFGWRG